MTLFSTILLLCACAANFGVQAVYFTHMLQLNSYRSERYRKWCLDNTGRLLTPKRWLLPVIAAILPPVLGDNGMCAAAALLFLSALLNIPPKAKKPLVVTARVKRLFATLTVLFLLVGAVLWFIVRNPVGALLLAIFSSLVWLWVWLALLINTPMEKMVATHYINDARARIQSVPDLTVIGITGSYGKTSTKNFLHALLSVKYNVLMTPESFNTTMGVVRTIREHLSPTHRIFIAEMGAKNPGDIKEICDLVHPRYGILTSIGEQHLETFKTVDNIVRTKFELVDALPENGAAFLNLDNAYIRGRAVTNVPVVGYGVEAGHDAAYVASDITVGSSGSSFTVTAPNGESRAFTTKLLGSHNIQNLIGCIAVAHTLGVTLEELVYPVRMLKPVPHRLQLLPNGYIDDAYNSNPAGFRAALDVLRGFTGQRVLVTPGMVELGERQAALNKELGAYAADCCDYAVLVGEKQAPPLRDGLLSAGFPEERLYVAKTLQDGLRWVGELPFDPGRTVLLENDLPDNF